MQDIIELHDDLSSLIRRTSMLNKSKEDMIVELEQIVGRLKAQIKDYDKYVDAMADAYERFVDSHH